MAKKEASFTLEISDDEMQATFAGRICGVTRFGLFVKLDHTGADGLIPIRTLPQDYYDHDERLHALVGRRNGARFRLGEAVQVRLVEADALTASTLFALAGSGNDEPRRDTGRRHGRVATGPRKTVRERKRR